MQGDCVVDVPPESQVHKQVVRKRAEVRDIKLDPVGRRDEPADPLRRRPDEPGQLRDDEPRRRQGNDRRCARPSATWRARSAERPGSTPRSIFELVIVVQPGDAPPLLGIDPVELGQAPFALATADSVTSGAHDLDLAGVAPTRASTSCPASPAMSAPTPPPSRCRRRPGTQTD
jgi:hypothetical protein